ncbi:aromatic ring-hydroxylating dioxygenase subunit alpha [Streptomyces poriferorum]|uniref:aromatic ring-hydroxylating dioxygenase subunit alpha n=1 Tax=Streptomyces poriferorum TaxID=2798799 RepID=UPI00273D9599|nr:aromatic ring-hydroxylating dioxygenase subunit alpha [Streptomyces sp. Alt1]WLQ52114.1 aromatic ring-hydroxylating dioxygenase subunit alpha [Streptomyces sp. Alt1]
MFKNFWYAVEFADRVGRKPAKVVCLGQSLVLYRTKDGRPVALSDLCAHRGAALSGGSLSDDCVVCPYHGWRFDPEGACTSIPANMPGRGIPKKARVDSYPACERYGFVWVFMGDLPEAERPPIPVWPEFDDLVENGGSYRMVTGEYLWNSNYERVLENGCDIAHTPFVHGAAFGNPDRPEVEEYTVEQPDEWSAFATVSMHPPAAKGLWSKLYADRKSQGQERPPVVTTAGWMLPNLVKLHVRLPFGNMIIYDTNIPVDETTTLVKWVALRDFFTGSWADANARKRVYRIFGQDAPVVDATRPELLPADLGAELHLRSDMISVAYRRRRQELAAKGWAVGSGDRITGDVPERTSTVIASPGRRDVPEFGRAWEQKAHGFHPTVESAEQSAAQTAHTTQTARSAGPRAAQPTAESTDRIAAHPESE